MRVWEIYTQKKKIVKVTLQIPCNSLLKYLSLFPVWTEGKWCDSLEMGIVPALRLLRETRGHVTVPQRHKHNSHSRQDSLVNGKTLGARELLLNIRWDCWKHIKTCPSAYSFDIFYIVLIWSIKRVNIEQRTSYLVCFRECLYNLYYYLHMEKLPGIYSTIQFHIVWF